MEEPAPRSRARTVTLCVEAVLLYILSEGPVLYVSVKLATSHHPPYLVFHFYAPVTALKSSLPDSVALVFDRYEYWWRRLAGEDLVP